MQRLRNWFCRLFNKLCWRSKEIELFGQPFIYRSHRLRTEIELKKPGDSQ
jgi:hypothetical protein